MIGYRAGDQDPAFALVYYATSVVAPQNLFWITNPYPDRIVQVGLQEMLRTRNGCPLLGKRISKY